MSDEPVYLCRIQRALRQATVWGSDLQEPDSLSGEQILLAAEAGRALLQILWEARAAGISEQAVMTLNSKPITLSEVQALGQVIAAYDRKPRGNEPE